MRRRILLMAMVASLALGQAGWTADTLAASKRPVDGEFTTSDGVRLHYLQAGTGRTVVLVPGWTMPAWIFNKQIADWSRFWHVVALDPRSQGDSEIAASGHEPFRRGRDIAELLDHLGVADVLLLGWSLGVLDVLSYIHQFGDNRIAGLVLVDNSVGEDSATQAPPARGPVRRRAKPLPRDLAMRSFVQGMFAVPPTRDYINRLTEAALRTPPDAAAALLAYPVPRSFWKEAVFSTDKPILYIVRPRLSGQAASLEADRPNAQSVVMTHVGHAMFVDAPTQFDKLVTEFIRQSLWR